MIEFNQAKSKQTEVVLDDVKSSIEIEPKKCID